MEHISHSEQFKNEVRDFLLANPSISARALGRKAGLNVNYINHVLSSARVPSIDNAAAVRRAMRELREGAD